MKRLGTGLWIALMVASVSAAAELTPELRFRISALHGPGKKDTAFYRCNANKKNGKLEADQKSAECRMAADTSDCRSAAKTICEAMQKAQKEYDEASASDNPTCLNILKPGTIDVDDTRFGTDDRGRRNFKTCVHLKILNCKLAEEWLQTASGSCDGVAAGEGSLENGFPEGGERNEFGSGAKRCGNLAIFKTGIRMAKDSNPRVIAAYKKAYDEVAAKCLSPSSQQSSSFDRNGLKPDQPLDPAGSAGGSRVGSGE